MRTIYKLAGIAAIAAAFCACKKEEATSNPTPTPTPTPTPVVEIDEYSDNANCFIVKPGRTSLVPASQGVSGIVPSLDSVKLLWQDVPGLLESLSLNADKKKIQVKMAAGKEGNVVVSGYKDTAVVWTWHFWVLNESPASISVQDTASKKTYVFMDRNIGATSVSNFANSSVGVIYQWGRNIPLSGLAYQTKQEGDFIPMFGATDKDTVVRTFEPCTLVDNIDNAQANPLVVYGGNSTYKSGSYTWVTSNYASADKEKVKNLWNGSTKYNPCPAGWCVCDSAAFTALATHQADTAMIRDMAYIVDASVSGKWTGVNATRGPKQVTFRGCKINFTPTPLYFMVSGDCGSSNSITASNYVSMMQPSAECWTSNFDPKIYSGATYFRAKAIKINASWNSTANDIVMNKITTTNYQFGYQLPVRCIKVQ